MWPCYRLPIVFLTILKLSACTSPPAPQVEVYGWTAVTEQSGVRSFRFDGDDRPRLRVTGEDKGLEFGWGDDSIAKVVARRNQGGAVMITLARPALATTQMCVRRGGKPWCAKVRFGPSAFDDPRVQAISKSKTVHSLEDATAAIPDDLWPWACVAWARRAKPGERVDAYLACADGSAARGVVSEAASRRTAALFWARQGLEFQRAAEIQEQAERDVARLADAKMKARLSFQVAVRALDAGELRVANKLLSEAVLLAERAGEDGEAAMMAAARAIVVSEIGAHKEALELVAQLKERPTEGLSTHDAAALRANVGWVRLRAGIARRDVALLASARADLSDAYSRYQELEAPEFASSVAASLALLELRTNNATAAQAQVDRALRSSDAQATSETDFLHVLQGELHMNEGQLKRARDVYEKVAGRDQGLGVRRDDHRWRAHLGLAEVDLAEGKARSAAKWLAEARLGLAQIAGRVGGHGRRLSFFHDRRRLYETLVGSLIAADSITDAWRVADESAALMYRSMERDRAVRLARLPPKSQKAWKTQEAGYLAARKRFVASKPNPLATAAELGTWRQERQKSVERLEVDGRGLEEALNAIDGTAVRSRFTPSMLADDEALLEILVGQGARGHAFWITRRGVVHRELTEANVTRWLNEEPAGHLYVVDGGWIPTSVDSLAELQLKEGLVVERWSLSSLPHADWLARPSVEATGAPLVIADPERNLPQAYREGQEVAKLLKAELLTREEATLERVLQKLDGRRLVHFAGHGWLAHDVPWKTGLRLAGGDFLDLETLLVKRPQAAVVVLSGCDTAAQTEAPADGVGLAEAFLAAGARAVVASIRPVKDDQTRIFIQSFYRHGGDKQPAAAYRAAAREMLANKQDGWRGFKVVGRRR